MREAFGKVALSECSLHVLTALEFDLFTTVRGGASAARRTFSAIPPFTSGTIRIGKVGFAHLGDGAVWR
jgi:hypothetical protein